MGYLDLISGLSSPTPEQTIRFANHVVTNHSWYKHLPFYPPGQRFVFYLDPHAGHEVQRSVSGAVTIIKLEHGDYFRHHSRLSTAEYQDRFGHWEYAVGNANPELLVPEPARRTSRWWALAHRLRLLARFLSHMPIDMLTPSVLARRWSCRLTAFCRPILTMHLLSGYASHDDYLKTFKNYARTHPDDPDVSRFRPIVSLVEERKEAAWLEDDMHAFMVAEAYFERDLVLRRLNEIRAEIWPESARPLDLTGPIPYPEADFIARSRREHRAPEIASRGFSIEDQLYELMSEADGLD